MTSVVVGGAVWLGHCRVRQSTPARRRLAGRQRAPGEAAARLLRGGPGRDRRRARIYLLGEGAGNALAAALGVADAEGASQTVGLIILPILSAIPYAVAWWMYARWMEGEASTLGSSERVETEDRLQLYPVALVGLAFGATATAWLIGILIDVLLGGEQVLSGDAWRRELAQFAPFARPRLRRVDLALAWRDLALGGRPGRRGSSTTRWATLLIVLAVGIGAGVISTGFILYRLFGSIFGLTQSGDAVSELSLPFGVALVAAAVALYHCGPAAPRPVAAGGDRTDAERGRGASQVGLAATDGAARCGRRRDGGRAAPAPACRLCARGRRGNRAAARRRGAGERASSGVMNRSMTAEGPCRVLLIGMMGSGKSTIGRLLSDATGWPYIDNDELVRQTHGATARQILAERGEARMRAAESDALAARRRGRRHRP